MSGQTLPGLPEGWSYFVTWQDLALALGGAVAVTFLLIWWAQQTRHWYRIAVFSFLVAFALSFLSIYLFEVPPYYAGCPAGCMGWRGFPLPVGRITRAGMTQIGLFDFLLNLVLLWLLVLLAALLGRLAGTALNWEVRSWRTRGLTLLVLILVPWALLPRYLDPPQPATTGEELRLVTNARRAAEMTYGITGLWVQRLALEDVRQLSPNPLSEAAPEPGSELNAVRSQVCLRGYTYFYVPWRRYRVNLEPTGVTALDVVELPLDGPCWE
jgi:hypothetical protein